MSQPHLSNLNLFQKEAVESIRGPVLIIAGPGSGKTRVITSRIAHLIKECEVAPHRIGALTFTNKAANEIAQRVGRALNNSTEQNYCWTNVPVFSK